jgi:carbon storage regulator CsrA
MLVLSRQRGETVMIGDQIDVTIIDVRGEKVRLGINAPRDVSVHRKEIYEQIKEQNRAAAGMKVEDLPKSAPRPTPVALEGGLARPESSPLFQVWKDPGSGIESFILSTRVAPVQQSFESNLPFAKEGRYLWFYCAFPPGGDAEYGRSLAVVDLRDGDVRHFPETQFGHASPMIDIATGDAYWSTGAEIYRRTPNLGGQAVRVARIDAALGKAGPAISSRLSRSADGKFLSIDAAIDDASQVGTVAIDGSGAQIWHSFDQRVSSEFNPIDTEVMLVVGEGGKLWTIERGGEPKLILPAKETKAVYSAWWSGDGKSVYFVDGEAGMGRIDMESGKREVLWAAATQRGHVMANGKGLVADWGSRVAFYNLETGKGVNIVATMPAGPLPPQQYHTQPRPRFCFDDRYVSYTTTVNGRVDVALALTETLLAETK